MYKLVKVTPMSIVTSVERLSDNAFIPFDPDNTDYQAYLKWVEEGNLPYPSDFVEPSPTASVTPLPADEQLA